MSADLRSEPRRLGRCVEWVGDLLERTGIRLGEIGAELAWRKWRAMRRWGQ